MNLRKIIEELSTSYTEGYMKTQDRELYNLVKTDFTNKNILDSDTIEFISKLLGWLANDGTEFTQEEKIQLDIKNIAYVNEEGLKTVVFIGCDNEDPSDEDFQFLKDIYDGKILYGIKNNNLVFWNVEDDKTVNKDGILSN